MAHRSSRLGWEVACSKFNHVPLARTQRIQKGQDKTEPKPRLSVDPMGGVAPQEHNQRASTTGPGPQTLPLGSPAKGSLPLTECSPHTMADSSSEYWGLLCCQLWFQNSPAALLNLPETMWQARMRHPAIACTPSLGVRPASQAGGSPGLPASSQFPLT